MRITRDFYLISSAARLLGMHPQTLRMYEARGLIEPKRSPKGTRLYSQDDVEKRALAGAARPGDGHDLTGAHHDRGAPSTSLGKAAMPVGNSTRPIFPQALKLSQYNRAEEAPAAVSQ